jgi:hypothetical protein
MMTKWRIGEVGAVGIVGFLGVVMSKIPLDLRVFNGRRCPAALGWLGGPP